MQSPRGFGIAAMTVRWHLALAMENISDVLHVGWRHASVDVVAAMRFEARLAGADETIVDTHEILTAQVVPGNEPSTFWIAVTVTAEGAERMRQAIGGNYTRAEARHVADRLLKG